MITDEQMDAFITECDESQGMLGELSGVIHEWAFGDEILIASLPACHRFLLSEKVQQAMYEILQKHFPGMRLMISIENDHAPTIH